MQSFLYLLVLNWLNLVFVFMVVEMDLVLFVVVEFVLLGVIFFLMMRVSNKLVSKKFKESKDELGSVDERASRALALANVNAKEIDVLKKALAELKDNKVGPFDDSIAVPKKQSAFGIESQVVKETK